MTTKEPKKTIWCLFSVLNGQPDKYLIDTWQEKPSLDAVSRKVFGCRLSDLLDDGVLKIVQIWRGEGAHIGTTDYRIETSEVSEP